MFTNNQKYLISLDLDGTLLKSDKTISSKTISYLQKLEKDGNIIVLNSGRAPRSIKIYYDLLKLVSPFIAYNGAYIHFNDSSLDLEYKLSQKIIKYIYKSLFPKFINATISENNKEVFINTENEIFNNFFNPMDLKVTKGEFTSILNDDVYTFLFEINEPVNENKKLIKEFIHEIQGYEVRFWNSLNIGEIHLSNVNKACSLEKIAKICRVFDENILVFGDAENDVELFQNFKNSFIMLNGAEHIKSFAKFITKKDNDHDGVIFEIENFLKTKV